LEMNPADIELLKSTGDVYHNHLFDFEGALVIDTSRHEYNFSVGSKLVFMEANLTAVKFDDCVKAASELDDPQLQSALKVFRDSFKFACLWGAGQKDAALQSEATLLGESTQLQRVAWDFAGTLHYLDSSPAFVTGRAAWIALFQSLQDGNGVAMAAALNQLEEAMKH